MEVKNIKTIDVNGKEWFDKVSGNSYFSCVININYKLKDEVILKIPFTYGYDEQYLYDSLGKIREFLNIKRDHKPLWLFCEENNIILRYDKKENCLKKELKNGS